MPETLTLPKSLSGAPPQQWIAAPSPVYLTGEEFLRLTTLANVAGITLTVSGRILRPDNTISRILFTHAPSSSRAATTTIVPLSEGWLLGLTIRATSGAPAFGQVWANLELGIGAGGVFAVDQTLGYGFLTANTPFAWPISVNAQPLDGAGNLRSITGSTPAAGAEISETVPTGARWDVIHFRAQLLTSATVANRLTEFIVDDGTNECGRFEIGGGLTAGATWFVNLTPGGSRVATEPGPALSACAPSRLVLGAGSRIRTLTAAIQAGDQYSAVQYLVVERMTGE